MSNSTNSRGPWRALLFFGLALLALLSIGALKACHHFLTRGIEPGLPPPVPHGVPRLGFNVDLEQYDDDALEEALARISTTGAGAVKQSFYYDPQFDWDEAQRILQAVEAHDLQLVPLLDGNPTQSFAPPDDPAAFAVWAGEFARRFGQHVRYYVIWDEPNLAQHWGNRPPNPAEYAALLTAAAGAIRSADADAVIVAAPLAPTTETGPDNLADPLFLEGLYEAGAADSFDVVAGKPYGFYTGPEDRRVDEDTLNFSRAILLREVLRRHGDGQKALFAGNWGWNSLPNEPGAESSIWGQTDLQTQADHTVAALTRARREWPWMGLMFLEHWQPDVEVGNPRRGFTVAGHPVEEALRDYLPPADVAYPGFHLAQPESIGQSFSGSWRFSPEYGADVSQTGDAVTLHFWGTDAGLRVRRGDYRARLYVTVDGQPANALPQDEQGTALVLTSPVPEESFVSTEIVAENLAPGQHTMTIEAHRGWGQWALNGFAVAYHPTTWIRPASLSLFLLALVFLALGIRSARRANWNLAAVTASERYRRLSEGRRLALTVGAAALLALTGWLTWGEQAAGIYRRLGDGGQLALTAAAASIFYVTPVFFLYLGALVLLFFLVYARPAWGLALVAFSFPLFVVPKPMLGYRFSPVEIFLLVTVAAAGMAGLTRLRREVAEAQERQALSAHLKSRWDRLRAGLVGADYAVLLFLVVATLSLLFTERLDVAENEWRVVILEPVLFYALTRALRPSRREVWTILDAYVLGALAVAVYGLWTYVQGQNVITVAGGLARLRSIYGSPNNVALYLGRTMPLLVAMALMGRATPRRRLLYALALAPVGLALLLTFSKGALFLGVPAALLSIFILWRRRAGKAIWPWLLSAAVLGGLALAAALSIPALSSRLDVQGVTSASRVSLWRSSLEMFSEHPITGVGLDNFLYAYRGRYILDAGWEEPNLNHPHNVILDFATRLGLLGLLAGGWLFWSLFRNLRRLLDRTPLPWQPVTIGLVGAAAHMVAHGLVDHSFFLVDLAFTFFLALGLAVWLNTSRETHSVT